MTTPTPNDWRTVARRWRRVSRVLAVLFALNVAVAATILYTVLNGR